MYLYGRVPFNYSIKRVTWKSRLPYLCQQMLPYPLCMNVAIPFAHQCCHTFCAPMLPYLCHAFVAIPLPTWFLRLHALSGVVHDTKLAWPGHVKCGFPAARRMKKNSVIYHPATFSKAVSVSSMKLKSGVFAERG